MVGMPRLARAAPLYAPSLTPPLDCRLSRGQHESLIARRSEPSGLSGQRRREEKVRIGRISRAVAALGLGSGLTAGVLLATTGAAFADYGPGAAYQVEISANTNNLSAIGGKTNGSGGGLWFWAALTPTSSSGGTVDYQEDDCIHGVPVAPNGDTHNAFTTTYTVTGGTLTINDVVTGAGPVDITLPSTDGHYVYPDSSFPPLFGGSVFSLLPAQVQVAP